MPDGVFQYGMQQTFAPSASGEVKADDQCLDPSTLLYHQPVYNSPGAVTDAGSSPMTNVKTEPIADEFTDSFFPIPHPSWRRLKTYREDSVSVDGSDSSSFHSPVYFMPTPALTPSTTPAPSVVDSAGPATPYHYMDELDDDDDASFRPRSRAFSRRATPFVFDAPSSQPSSRSSSFHPSSPEPSARPRLPTLRVAPTRERNLHVKKEECDESSLAGCMRTKRQESVKVPWPERRKRIDERTTVWTTVKGKRKLMYQCDFCGRHLGRHPDLHRHEKTHFIAQKTLCCDIVKGTNCGYILSKGRLTLTGAC